MSSKTSLLPKSFSQKHIFNLIYARAFKGQKEQKRSLKKGSKHKIAYYETKWDFKVPKMHNWVEGSQKYVFNSSYSLEAIQRPKKNKIRPKSGYKIQNCIL